MILLFSNRQTQNVLDCHEQEVIMTLEQNKEQILLQLGSMLSSMVSGAVKQTNKVVTHVCML